MDPQMLQQAQLEAFLGSDLAPFETLIFHLMSPSNEQRSQAELIFNLFKETDLNLLFLKLGDLLKLSPHTEARAMSAILLRVLTRRNSWGCEWFCLETRDSLIRILLTCVEQEESKTVLRQLSHTISELAPNFTTHNHELLQSVSSWLSSGSPRLQESALLIYGQLPYNDYIVYMLTCDREFRQEFFRCLNTGSSDVRIVALGAASNFSSEWYGFQELLTSLTITSTKVLNGGQEATAQEALKLLIELVDTKTRFFMMPLEDMVWSMLEIAETKTLEEGTRHLAIEFVTTLAEATHSIDGMSTTRAQLFSKLFDILLKMLLDIEDEPAWHTTNDGYEDAGGSNNYNVGKQCLNRLAIALGGTTVVPVALEQLRAYFGAPKWQKRHAALIALAQISKGCSQVMITNLHEVIVVFKSFEDSHPRVRWAAINAIRKFAKNLAPHFQEQYNIHVLAALIKAMDDSANPRIKAYAISTYIKSKRLSLVVDEYPV